MSSTLRQRHTDRPPTRPKLRRINGTKPAEPERYENWEAALASHFTVLPNGLLRGELELSNDEQAMLLVLMSWIRGTGSGSVALWRRGGIRVRNLAAWANQSRAQAYRSLTVLQERGYVSVEHIDGGPSEYTLHLDVIAQQLDEPPPTPEPEATPSRRNHNDIAVDDDMRFALLATDLDNLSQPKPTLKPLGKQGTPNRFKGICQTCHRPVAAGEGIMKAGPRHRHCV